MQRTNLAREQVFIVNLLLDPLHQLCNILHVWLRVSGVCNMNSCLDTGTSITMNSNVNDVTDTTPQRGYWYKCATMLRSYHMQCHLA